MQEKKNIPENVRDIIIVGGGPAGLTAGLYAARGRMNTLLVESLAVMGQATMTERIENYPGVENAAGFDLVNTFKKQAVEFGLECGQGTVKRVFLREEEGIPVWRVESDGGMWEALSIVVASGAYPRKLGISGEKEFMGKGVSYCATCDGAFFREKDIIVVGGGDAAVEEALFLTRFGRKVKIIHRRERLRAAKILQERAFANEKIEFVWESVVEEIIGKKKVEKVRVRNVETGKISDVLCDGVFIFVGWEPNTGFIKGVVELDQKGYIRTDNEMKTSGDGMFAAGDCRGKLLRQIVTACGDGATAAFSAQHYVERLKGTAY